MSQPFASGTFNWVDLVAKDLPKIRAFYEKIFGWTYAEQDTQGGPPYGMFLKDGKNAAGIGQMSEEMINQGVPSTWNTYVSVDDIKAAEQKIKELGGELMFETMDIFDAGRTNWVKDPQGAIFALWEPGKHHGAESYNVPGTFCWNERATRQLEPVKAFYGGLFRWSYKDEVTPTSAMAMIYNQGREMGHVIVMTEQWGNVPDHWSIYFAVDDCDATMAQTHELGGKVIMGPVDIPAGRFALLSDPDGAMFYAIKLNEPGQ